MIVTQTAQRQIDQTLTDSEFLRVSVSGGGCSGFRFSLDRDETKQDGDILVTHNVVTDNISEGFLSKATLTWVDDPFQSTYKFEVPDARSCGCGSSFQFEETT
jgi:iron-sulfur cluster insertion protein